MRAICLSVAGLFCLGTAFGAPTVLSFAELKALEQMWAAHPDDTELTNRLGTNYGLDALGIKAFGANGTISGWAKTEPELALQAYAKAALASSRQAAIVGNAGSTAWLYSAISKDLSGRDFAQSLIDRAIELQPLDDRWRGQRIQITITRESYPFWKPISSAEAYPMALADFDAISRAGRGSQLPYVGMLAYRAGKMDDAERLAEELLAAHDQTNWNYGNAVLKGNSILGLIALRKGDTAAAKSDLLKAGATPGSPQLNSFGPNMTLASALIDAGERDSVLAYFDECRTFWTMDYGKLDQWSASVRAGKKPDFGANLHY